MYSNITDTQVSIQVTNLGIIDLGTVYLGKTVVKWKIINIPGGVASLDNTTISTVGVDNLNIYNKTIWLEDQVKHIIKRDIQPTVKTIIKSKLQKDVQSIVQREIHI